MDRQEFNNSWDGKKGKQPLAMLIANVRLECSCNKLFFTIISTTDLEGDFAKKCPLCRRIHRFSWDIATTTIEDAEEE